MNVQYQAHALSHSFSTILIGLVMCGCSNADGTYIFTSYTDTHFSMNYFLLSEPVI